MKTPELDKIGKPYKIYTDVLEDKALQQFTDAMKNEHVVKGALMPDAHMGYTLPIGAVVATNDMIFPSFVGYDIGCGVLAIKTSFNWTEVKRNAVAIFNEIYKVIPVGFNHNIKDSFIMESENPIDDFVSETLLAMYIKSGRKQIGTLGGGNHFIEIGYDSMLNVWIIIHSGSRGMGHDIASHYMKIASGSDKAKEGFYGLRPDSYDGRKYIDDMNFCLDFALENRREMASRVEDVIKKFSNGGCFWRDLINRNHNHAELNKDGLWIHRKGATHAEKGMMGVIPGNMKLGSYIVQGKGCEDSLCSSSHGAGRAMGRMAASKNLSLDKFEDDMYGIVACVTKNTLDESPDAYKDIREVMSKQVDLINMIEYILPLINVKDNTPSRKKK